MDDGDIPRYDRDHLPAGDWAEYRYKIGPKTSAGRMVQVHGPCVVTTNRETRELPTGWHGFLAIDSDGYPALLPIATHARAYERVDTGAGTFTVRYPGFSSVEFLVSAGANLFGLVTTALWGIWLLVALFGLNAAYFTYIAYIVRDHDRTWGASLLDTSRKGGRDS